MGKYPRPNSIPKIYPARRPSTTPILVEDEAIIAARDQLWDDYRIPTEHGAAAAFAALASAAYQPREDENVAVIICGANTDLRTLGSIRAGISSAGGDGMVGTPADVSG